MNCNQLFNKLALLEIRFIAFVREQFICFTNIVTQCLSQKNEKSITAHKTIFFENFYYLWTFEGYEDAMQAVEIARGDAEISLEKVIEALQEVEDRKLNDLVATKSSPTVVWFTINAAYLARFIKQNMASSESNEQF